MANYEVMIPFVMHFAAGVYGKNGEQLRLPLEEQFELARKRGWSDDPDDPGGATMIDVTISTYTAYRKKKGSRGVTERDLRNISFDEWKEILKTMYWDRWQADRIASQGIANMLVDWIWASGPRSIRKAQSVMGVTPDGIVGEKTLHAVNTSEPTALFRRIYQARAEHYKSCAAARKYLKGWMRRLDAILPDGSFNYNSGG